MTNGRRTGGCEHRARDGERPEVAGQRCLFMALDQNSDRSQDQALGGFHDKPRRAPLLDGPAHLSGEVARARAVALLGPLRCERLPTSAMSTREREALLAIVGSLCIFGGGWVVAITPAPYIGFLLGAAGAFMLGFANHMAKARG